WKLADPGLIQQVLRAMNDKSLIIADGHHRYETSVAYMHERARELGLKEDAAEPSPFGESFSDMEDAADPSELPAPPFPESAMMMTFVNMDAPGITILPTHRVVFGLQGFSGRQFAKEAEQGFSVEEISSEAASSAAAPDLLQRLEQAPGTAFVAATRDGAFLLTPKPETVEHLSSLSPHQAQLDVVQLHRLVLEGMLHLDEDAVRTGDHVRYIREAGEALREVAEGKADVAFLIKPVTLQQMKDVSLNLEVMPQKSTDFYPKLLSGLAMYALD
ncbi:MAG: DUF1015 domain-containing protein, partial [Terriglobus roseus]|nr:DUF1015 domain-containing protein [Terriglobus roseus]